MSNNILHTHLENGDLDISVVTQDGPITAFIRLTLSETGTFWSLTFDEDHYQYFRDKYEAISEAEEYLGGQ